MSSISEAIASLSQTVGWPWGSWGRPPRNPLETGRPDEASRMHTQAQRRIAGQPVIAGNRSSSNGSWSNEKLVGGLAVHRCWVTMGALQYAVNRP